MCGVLESLASQRRTRYNVIGGVNAMAWTKEERRAYDAAYHVKNREKLNARHRVRYGENRERELAKANAYAAEHREERRERDRAYLATHRDEIREVKRQYRKDHRVERKESEALRRARKAGVTVVDREGIKRIYRRARECKVVRCYLCNRLIPLGERHVDHIVPLSRGGEHNPGNLAIACFGCNTSKSNKMPEEIGLLL